MEEAADIEGLDEHVEIRRRCRCDNRLGDFVEEGQQVAHAVKQFKVGARRRAKQLLLTLR